MAQKQTDARKLAERARELDRLYQAAWNQAYAADRCQDAAEKERLRRSSRRYWRLYKRLRDTPY